MPRTSEPWNDNTVYTPTQDRDSTMTYYRPKSYEPWRIVNIWKKSKAGGSRLWRKTQYHGKELAMRLEKWRHR
ncbi:hypothetical protein COCOBI_04-5010 [Coccomyxa sp. Obi]|nr:hypothetical protein COCOBI_04-5010 [Coccomyxa sp. Obi]